MRGIQGNKNSNFLAWQGRAIKFMSLQVVSGIPKISVGGQLDEWKTALISLEASTVVKIW